MKTDYAGIDYSLGRSNIDHETGIHYGVVQHDVIGSAWYEDSEPHYIFACPYCENELPGEVLDEVVTCPDCETTFNIEEFDCLEPVSFYYDAGGYQAEQSYDDPDIFITKAPCFTYCQYCSPCAPGAGYLTNWTDEGIGIKAYCFGHDWYESGVAPYPVYDVKTGELIEPTLNG